MNEELDDAFPPTPEEAEVLGEPYIPWHPHELSPERKAAWYARERDRELTAFRERRRMRMTDLGMIAPDNELSSPTINRRR